MKTFVNLNLIVLSSDFQDFLKLPEEVIVTNRPTTYTDKIFNDVYVIGQNLAFMTYLSQFNDLYIAYRLKSASDITKGYHTTPLIATSMPKNTLTIKTANSKDWTDYLTNQNPLVSSTTATSGFVAGDGLRIESSTDQSLIFNLKAGYSDVTSYASTAGTTIDDNWSFQILMNPQIKLNGSPVLSESTTSLTVEAETVDNSDAYNKYTLVTLKGTQSDDLQTTFKTTATKTAFGVFPFRIQTLFSSIYSNEDNMDIMIATTDGIDGPLNKIVHNGFFLINSFTMMADAQLNTLNVGFVAYSHSSQMDGSEVPTLIRAKGSIAGSTGFDSLAIFFDKLTPFFSNYHNGDIFCHSTDGSPYCKFYKGAEDNALIYNYQTFSRIEIPLTTPTTAFDIMVPITAEQGNVRTYFYLGYIQKDSVTGKKSIVYMEPMRTITHTGSVSTNGVYGPDVTSANVGDTISSMTLKARAPSGLSQNSGDNLGAAYLYFSEWDFFGSSAVTGWTNGGCYKMTYLLYQTNYDAFLTGSTFTYTYKSMRGLVCFADTGTSVTSMDLTVATGYIPAKWGLIIPGFGGYSSNTGNLYSRRANYYQIPSALTITDLNTITTPTMGPLLVKSVGKWVITLPVAIDDDVEIIMTGNLGTTNLPFTSSTGTCAIYIASTKLPVGCVYTSSPTEVDYILTVHEGGLLAKDAMMSIVHYGLNTNSTYSTQNFDLKCYSLVYTASPGANDLIFQANSVPFKYGGDDTSYIGQSSITLSDFVQQINNKAAITKFEFNFNVVGKGLYATNRVRVNLGQYYTDNSASLINPICKIYTFNSGGASTMFSHHWSAVDTSQGLNKL